MITVPLKCWALKILGKEPQHSELGVGGLVPGLDPPSYVYPIVSVSYALGMWPALSHIADNRLAACASDQIGALGP